MVNKIVSDLDKKKLKNTDESNNKQSVYLNEYEELVESEIIDEIYGNSKKKDKFSKKKQVKIQQQALDETNDVAVKKDTFIDLDVYRFPVDLSNPWNISKVLMQTRNKLSIKDLKMAQKNSIKISAQAKVTFFN